MQEIVVKIDGTIEKINPSIVFHSKNPATNRFCVNLYYTEEDNEKWIQVFCQDEYTEQPAKILSKNICEGKLTDITNYYAERRL